MQHQHHPSEERRESPTANTMTVRPSIYLIRLHPDDHWSQGNVLKQIIYIVINSFVFARLYLLDIVTQIYLQSNVKRQFGPATQQWRVKWMWWNKSIEKKPTALIQILVRA
jgi:hypothetical protein